MTYEIKYRNEDEMKDSGIQWLGKVPKEWISNKVKYNIHYIQTGSTPTTKRPDYYEGNVNWFNPVDLNQEILEESKKKISKQAIIDNEAKLFSGDSVLIVGIGATAGKTSYLINRSSFNQQITGIHSKENNNKYIFYQFKSISNELLKLANFTTLPILNNEFLKNIGLGFPILIEQQNIVNFLNLKTSEFDSIISKKELLIEKLDEAKKSLISEVVTGKVKIVNGELVEREPEEMKDSGVQWLGMIPKEWEVKRLKYLVELRTEKQKVDIDSKYIGLENIESLTGKYIESKDESSVIEGIGNIFEFNDVLFGKLRPYLAKCIVASFDGLCSSEILVFNSTKLHNKLLKFNLLNSNFIDLVNSSTYGAKMPRANWEFIGNIFLPYMDLKSQKEIVYILDRIDSNIDAIITKTKLQIQKLKQAKQSLISEAVTGKIDLRDWEIQEI